MKIIKHGVKDSANIRFTCNGCECIFECRRDEATLVPDNRDGDFYIIDCPDCGKSATLAYKLT